ncbi:MAG: hypothetical protein JWQ55_4403 [Rhodopila sp.]|nr:hypothetical protein [Rhodopila sp.]
MIAQVLADAFECVTNLDAQALKQIRLADTGQFQKLRRIDRTAADDDLPVRSGLVLLSVARVPDTNAALAFEQQAFGQRVGLDRQVRSPARGIR